jgi:MFS family permease
VIFEVGSIICAAAPTSTAFIVGRAIAGLGSAGTGIGGIIIFVDLLPLQKRPKYQGSVAASFGLASIAGPLLGGFFTSRVSWRWCFWINVPIGCLAIVVLVLILPSSPPPRKHMGESFKQRVQQFDPIGTVFLLPGLVLLLLALQWGSNEYAWESTRVIVSIVLGLVLLIAFVICQFWARENGTIPPRIFGQRSVAAATATSFGFGSVLTILTFYLPIWYQAIKGLSAEAAGIRLLPYFLATVAFVITSGFLVSKVGYYTPVLNVGLALTVICCGLLTTFRVETSTAESIGFQVSARTS